MLEPRELLKRFAAATLLGLAFLGSAAGCSGDGSTAEPNPQPLAADVVIPNQSLTDWVSYANQVSVVTVLSEAEIEPPSEVRSRKEGYIGRTVMLRIDDTLWTAPGVSAVQGQISMTVIGWHLKGDRKIPFGGRLEAGMTYVMPIASIKGQWADASVTAPVPVAGPVVAASVKDGNSWTRELAGVSLSALSARLAATPPDPVAARFADLPGGERADAVRKAQGR